MKKEAFMVHPDVKPNKNPEALRVCMNCNMPLRNRPTSPHCSSQCQKEFEATQDFPWERKRTSW